MNRGESPCWPGLVRRAIGRHRRSATRWILVLSPPRDRPSPSRSGRDFLSFDGAPCVVLGGGRAAGSGGVLVGADHGGIHPHRPIRALDLVAASA